MLAQLTAKVPNPCRSLARTQALAARPAPRRHALPVRASRDAELKKMQEFKAGLNKHLEASKRPGATGEAPGRACKPADGQQSAQQHALQSDAPDRRIGPAAKGPLSLPALPLPPVPPPLLTLARSPLHPSASCSRRRCSGSVHRGASCRQEAAGGAGQVCCSSGSVLGSARWPLASTLLALTAPAPAADSPPYAQLAPRASQSCCLQVTQEDFYAVINAAGDRLVVVDCYTDWWV